MRSLRKALRRFLSCIINFQNKMKKFFKILSWVLPVIVCLIMVAVAEPGLDGWLKAIGGGVTLAMPPVVLDTQKIVFLRSLKEEYEAIDTWLSEAEDLSSFVEDGQTLVFPEAGAAPAVYKNRVIDIDDVEPEETTHQVSLDVYDSQNYKIRNIYLHALPFDKVQHYTKKSSDAIVKQEIEDAAHAFTPASAGHKRIVIPTTGLGRNGFKMMRLEDVVTLARALDYHEFPTSGRNLVLPSDMWWDLVNNNAILKGQLERVPLNGIIKPLVVEYYGIKIHKSEQKLNVGYNVSTSLKAPQGTIITGDVVPAGFLFIKTSVFRASGMFDMFRAVKSQNTKGRAEEFGFQHRFKADFQMNEQRYSAIVYAAKDVATSPSIEAYPTSLSFLAAGESKLVAVTASGAFTASVTGTGFSIVKDGNAVVVTAAANVGAERTGTLTVALESDALVTAEVELTQASGL